ncbi:hypothetical protein [Mesorhizobium salmacidum]|uniref:Uncharacterized protein n=1 Tax=Mesorhizobium salmacidum TaxID=3015171 RepID=A0ABU8KRF0_9HYPH
MDTLDVVGCMRASLAVTVLILFAAQAHADGTLADKIRENPSYQQFSARMQHLQNQPRRRDMLQPVDSVHRYRVALHLRSVEDWSIRRLLAIGRSNFSWRFTF